MIERTPLVPAKSPRRRKRDSTAHHLDSASVQFRQNPGARPGDSQDCSRGEKHRSFRMQIILRQTATGLLLRDDRGWTSNPSEARLFDSPLTAYRFAKQRGYDKVEVVVLRPDGLLGGTLPVA